PPPAGGTGLRKGLHQTLRDPLARHFNQAEFGDVEYLGAGLVASQSGPERLDHFGAVGRDLHVDEVDHDDAADVPQPELPGDLLGGLQVVAEDGLFQVGGTDVLAGVDVDDGESFGPLDDQRAA